MTRKTRRDIARDLEDLGDGDDPEQVDLWRAFIEGNYDPANPPEQIREWIHAGDH